MVVVKRAEIPPGAVRRAPVVLDEAAEVGPVGDLPEVDGGCDHANVLAAVSGVSAVSGVAS